MAEAHRDGVCECCGRGPRELWVGCCGFGAMSLGYCRECIEQGAEPAWGLAYLLYAVGDGDQDRLHSSVREMVTFHQNRYMKWSEWMENHEPPPPPPEWQPDPENPRCCQPEYCRENAPEDFANPDQCKDCDGNSFEDPFENEQ